MIEQKAFQLASEIIKLDLKRDELFEQLLSISGHQANDILRKMQNFIYDYPNR